MSLDYRNRANIRTENPEIADALDDILKHIEITMSQTNSTPSGQSLPPSGVQSIQVTAAGGIFDVSVTDSSNVNRGINYFLEYSLAPGFSAPVVIDLGAARNWRGFLGNQTLYWRAYSSYPTSSRSSPTYYGTQVQPIPVVGGGATSGPSPLPSQGSGTSTGGGGGDGGFGNSSFRGSELNVF